LTFSHLYNVLAMMKLLLTL